VSLVRVAASSVNQSILTEKPLCLLIFSLDFDVVIDDKEDKDYRIMLKMTQPMMQLRKIVNHPYLVHFPLVPGKNELRVDEELVRKSGKLLVLDAMLVKLKQRGHKVC
jgi:ATP-dependent DNA helicase